MPDVATTLLAIGDIGRKNLGVTLDFAHVLYADEMPAYAATLVGRRSRLLGVHLNDGYGKRDDGLMVGAVHPVQTIELLYVLERIGYDGPLYFDTFPDTSGQDPVAECSGNIAMAANLRLVVARLRGDEWARGGDPRPGFRREPSDRAQSAVRRGLNGAVAAIKQGIPGDA